MQSGGNDYVVIDGTTFLGDFKKLAVKLLDRHFGIGGDGLLIVLPSKRVDIAMKMFNPDGAESELCLNGVRCAVKFVIDKGLIK